jgi:hypothetical protein
VDKHVAGPFGFTFPDSEPSAIRVYWPGPSAFDESSSEHLGTRTQSPWQDPRVAQRDALLAQAASHGCSLLQRCAGDRMSRTAAFGRERRSNACSHAMSPPGDTSLRNSSENDGFIGGGVP